MVVVCVLRRLLVEVKTSATGLPCSCALLVTAADKALGRRAMTKGDMYIFLAPQLSYQPNLS